MVIWLKLGNVFIVKRFEGGWVCWVRWYLECVGGLWFGGFRRFGWFG